MDLNYGPPIAGSYQWHGQSEIWNHSWIENLLAKPPKRRAVMQ